MIERYSRLTTLSHLAWLTWTWLTYRWWLSPSDGGLHLSVMSLSFILIHYHEGCHSFLCNNCNLLVVQIYVCRSHLDERIEIRDYHSDTWGWKRGQAHSGNERKCCITESLQAEGGSSKGHKKRSDSCEKVLFHVFTIEILWQKTHLLQQKFMISNQFN